MNTPTGTPAASGWRLVHFFGLLGCLVALPALLFSAYLIARSAELERDSAQARLQEVARSLNASIDREVGYLGVTLRLLATAPSLENNDLPAFHSRAQAALRDIGAYMILVDRNGMQLLNTRVPYGTSLGVSSDPGPIAQALQTGRVTISGVFFGRVAQQYVFNVIVPVRSAALGDRALILTRNTGALAAILDDGLPSRDAAVTVVDAAGRVVVAMPGSGMESGQQLAADRLASLAGHAGLTQWSGPDGQPEIVAHVRSPQTGWVSYITLPAASLDKPFERSWRMLMTAGILLVLLTAALAMLLGCLLAAPIETLARDAEALGRGEPVPLRRTPLREANHVGAALHLAGRQRQEHEQHIQMLMRELTHRAKNLVAVVQAIASTTARHATTLEGFLAAYMPRLVAFGRSIDLLAGRNWSGVSLHDLVDAQAQVFSAGAGDRFVVDGPAMILKPIAAERLGLALHELSTNAAKYGALSAPAGRIEIGWSVTADAVPRFTLVWQERGGPTAMDSEHKGFGHQLTVVMPAQSLRGTVTTSFDAPGFRWCLSCPAHMVSTAFAS